MSSQLIGITNLPGTSPQTRQILESRLEPAKPAPAFFTPGEFTTLTTLCELVLPQTRAGTQVSLASLIDQRLAGAESLGWRFAVLPPDPVAFRTALRQITDLSTTPGITLTLLQAIQDKQHDTAAFPISLWFEGFKVELTRNWLAHPRTMALLNYQGFADDLLTPQTITA